MKIFEYVFYYTCVIIGLASACQMYNEFADYIVWIIIAQHAHLFIATIDGIENVLIKHYLDDFIIGHQHELVVWAQFYALTRLFE